MNFLKIIIPVALLGGTFVYLNDTDRTVRACMKRIAPLEYKSNSFTQTKYVEHVMMDPVYITVDREDVEHVMMDPVYITVDREEVQPTRPMRPSVHLRCMTASDDDLRGGLK